MGSITYTSEVHKKIDYSWKCSNCGTINESSKLFSAMGVSRQGGLRTKQKVANESVQDAQIQFSLIMDTLLTRQSDIKRYMELNLHNRCSKCNHREPWSFSFNTLINRIPAIVGFMVCMFCCCGGIATIRSHECIILFAISIGLVLLYYALSRIDKIVLGRQSKKLDALDSSAFPTVSDPAALKEYLAQLEYIPHKSKYMGNRVSLNSVDTLSRMCSGCGNTVPAGAPYCPVCGQKQNE